MRLNLPKMSQPVGLSLLVFMLLALAVLGRFARNRTGEKWAVEWFAVRNADSLAVEPVLTPALRDKEPVLSRLRQQLAAMQARKAYHGELTIFFLTRHNTTLIILLVSGLVAAGMLVIITAKGMSHPNPYVKATFATAAAIAALAAGIAGMYKQEDNAVRNAALYVSYENLQNQIRTFMATGRLSAADSAAGPAGFITSMDSSMAVLNDLAIGFDQSAAPGIDQIVKKLMIPAAGP
jgi:hypothetical protein